MSGCPPTCHGLTSPCALPACPSAWLYVHCPPLCPAATFEYGLRKLFSNAPNSAARRAGNGSTGGADGTPAGEGRIKCITEKRALQVEVGFKKLGKNALQLARALSEISDDLKVCLIKLGGGEGQSGRVVKVAPGRMWTQQLCQAYALQLLNVPACHGHLVCAVCHVPAIPVCSKTTCPKFVACSPSLMS